MSARLEGYKDFKKTAFFTKTLQRPNKIPRRLERFQKDSKRLAETSPMLADSNRTCNALLSAEDSNGKSDIPTMSAALSCQCDGPVNCCKLNPASSKLYAKTPCVESLSALNIKICDMKP